jgi:BA14K-like protein
MRIVVQTAEDVMRSKIIALASAAALAGTVTVVAGTGATAQRLPDDVYYYSGVTRAFGHTPRRDRYYGWAWPYGSVAFCVRHFRSYDPSTGTYLDHHGIPHPCP